MARVRVRVARAFALHRSTVATVAAATELLTGYSPAAAFKHQAEQRELTARLEAAAAQLVPGWLGVPLDQPPVSSGPASPVLPAFLRIGQARLRDDARFPVVVPLLGAGHVAIDADSRDLRVAGLLQALLLRLVGASPPGAIQVRIVDCAGTGVGGETLGSPGVAPAVTDHHGLRSVLDEAERWVATPLTQPYPCSFVLVIASLPELTDGADLARIYSLASAGPAARLHLIAAGWPPPPLTAETTQRPLPHSTQISLRNPHAWVSDPPGATYDSSTTQQSRLPAPVFLDSVPQAGLLLSLRTALAPSQRSAGGSSSAATPPGAPLTPASHRAVDHRVWTSYVAAVQRLTTCQQAAAAWISEQETARTSLLEQLGSLRARLAGQATPLRELVASGVPAPRLSPAAVEVAAVRDGMLASGAEPMAAASAALRSALGGTAAVDRAIRELDAASVRALIRNIGVYGVFTAIVALLQLPVLLLFVRSIALALLGLPCALVLSSCGFLSAWFVIGVLNGRTPGDRSSAAGVIVSLAGTFPVLATALILAFSH